MITIHMPYNSPPLRSNQRLHWGVKARITRAVRADAKAVTQSHCIGHANREMLTRPVAITLVWEVTDNRRRDVGASSPTLKAWIDGMVDAGLLRADSHDVVAEERLRIEVGNHKGVRVEIEPAERGTTT